MNRWCFATAALAVGAYGALAPSGVAEAEGVPAAPPVVTRVPEADPPQTVGNSPPEEPQAPKGDPFAMRGVADGDGFVSAAPAAVPPGIRVVAILAMVGRPSVGALAVPGSKNLHFVREGDVIQVDRPAGSASASATESHLYLLIQSITPSQIEIAPRTRPQDVRIYR